MLSDFGLSKEMTPRETYHSSGVMRYHGTSGWIAPEIINASENTGSLGLSKSADIFSLGCVFYYIIYDGKHPFGEGEARQKNILSNKSLIDDFRIMSDDGLLTGDGIPKGLVVMGNVLAGAMIEPQPERRPPIASVLKFPMFWSKKEKLNFLVDVSDSMDSDATVAEKLRLGQRKVFGYDWRQKLSLRLQENLTDPTTKHRSYNARTIKDLLRVIRNKKNHYSDFSEELKQELGDVPDGFLDYFESRFPELIVYVYKNMQSFRDEQNFRDYYEQNEEYTF